MERRALASPSRAANVQHHIALADRPSTSCGLSFAGDSARGGRIVTRACFVCISGQKPAFKWRMEMNRKVIELAALVMAGSLGFACGGGVAGARPSDMSEQQHAAVAEQHQKEADQHARQYDPKAVDKVYTDCVQYLGSCWSTNPTEEHKKQADEHMRMAAAHRAGARALVDAEARACQGVSEADRDISPFFHREAIVEVKPLPRERGGGERKVEEGLAGATIVLLPASGVTAERLERIVQCHIARNAALGNDMPEMPYCPLVPKGVSANVTSTGNGFAVTIMAQDQATAAEVLRRAQALAPR